MSTRPSDRLPGGGEHEQPSEDFVLSWMRDNNVPLTKENYLAIAYLGDDPDLDAEALAAIPDLQDVGRMSPEQKAELRQQLEKAFPRKESK
jgi:hypothetical protein